jgi:hypothetical protein
MFIMGAVGPKNRITYFAGAFPSACGKTSTAMLPGQTIVGDDIAYFRKRNGKMVAANVEQGIFGIIEDVNAKDDPVIFKALKPRRGHFRQRPDRRRQAVLGRHGRRTARKRHQFQRRMAQKARPTKTANPCPPRTKTPAIPFACRR